MTVRRIFTKIYIFISLSLAFFRKPGKLGSHTGSKWWPGDPDVEDDPNDPLTRWLNDPVSCLLTTYPNHRMSQHPPRSITVLGKDLITDNFPTVSLVSLTLVSSLECWIMMFINYYITRPTYYTCVQLQFDRLRVVIKRLILLCYILCYGNSHSSFVNRSIQHIGQNVIATALLMSLFPAVVSSPIFSIALLAEKSSL